MVRCSRHCRGLTFRKDSESVRFLRTERENCLSRVQARQGVLPAISILGMHISKPNKKVALKKTNPKTGGALQ